MRMKLVILAGVLMMALGRPWSAGAQPASPAHPVAPGILCPECPPGYVSSGPPLCRCTRGNLAAAASARPLVLTETGAACAAEPAASELSPVTPAPVLLSLTCGSCSKDNCPGATYNQVCGHMGGQTGYCLSPYGNNCSGIQPMCQCWYGPLP
ncbi:MAG TPA: hypothetical protein VMW75_24820 [Thermoanaerobaculia bacterium]|nr:hypothetical protein [Thermoanaerobaculia bacterium]